MPVTLQIQDYVATVTLDRPEALNSLDPESIAQLAHADLSAEFPPLKSLGTRTSSLPLFLSSFIGRDRELKAVKEMARDSRLTSLTGSGGCGKTRLATQAAAELVDHFPDGLAAEFRTELVRERPCVAAFHRGDVVATCYAAVETEGLWDVAVDTLSDHRRMGLAAACFNYPSLGELLKYAAIDAA